MPSPREFEVCGIREDGPVCFKDGSGPAPARYLEQVDKSVLQSVDVAEAGVLEDEPTLGPGARRRGAIPSACSSPTITRHVPATRS